MFGVRREVTALVRMNGIQLVHFVFGEADGTELREAQTEAEDDEEGEAGGVYDGNVLEHFFNADITDNAGCNLCSS